MSQSGHERRLQPVKRLDEAYDQVGDILKPDRQANDIRQRIISILKLLTRLGHLIEEDRTFYRARSESLDPDDFMAPLQAAPSTWCGCGCSSACSTSTLSSAHVAAI